MLAAQGPVGTRGGVEWMRGPCACPGGGATCLLHAVPKGSRCHQDKHKAPTLPHIRPLSLQDPIRSSRFIRVTVQPVKDSSSQVNLALRILLREKVKRNRPFLPKTCLNLQIAGCMPR